jgi:hypothetical protein
VQQNCHREHFRTSNAFLGKAETGKAESSKSKAEKLTAEMGLRDN